MAPTTAGAGSAALSVRDLRKTYDNGVEALKGVSLDVAPGDFYALLGPNGAGKSTLIGIVSSLVNKSSGEVRVFDVDLHAERDRAMRLLGLVPQEINFNMFEKPLDILVNYAGFYGIPRREAMLRAEQELRRAQLWDKARSMARTRVLHFNRLQLAAMLLTSLWPLMGPELPDGLVRSALSISGVHDLEPVMYTPLYQESLKLTDQQVQQASPARLPAPQRGMLYCAVGGDESPEFIRQNHLMQDAWGSHFVPRSQVLPGLHHFSIVDALAQAGHDLHHMALNLLRS